MFKIQKSATDPDVAEAFGEKVFLWQFTFDWSATKVHNDVFVNKARAALMQVVGKLGSPSGNDGLPMTPTGAVPPQS